jgi:3-methylcrotonyl-CoA carboxylase alpha subunit
MDKAAAALGARELLTRERARIHDQIERDADAARSPHISPWDADDGFQLSGPRRQIVPILADGEKVTAQVIQESRTTTVTIDGIAAAPDAVAVATADAVYVLRRGRQTKVEFRDLSLDEGIDGARGGLVRAPMHGKVLSVLVEEGAPVTRGQRIAIIEAMKMEHTLVAPLDGTVSEVVVAKDDQVVEGAKLIVIESAKG